MQSWRGEEMDAKVVRLIEEPWFWWASLTGGVGAMLASVPLVIWALLGMMTLDVVVGLLAAGINGEINREKAFRGALRKVVILGVVGAAALIQLEMAVLLQTSVAPMLGNIPVNLPLTEFVGGIFIVYEFISILENATKAGVRLPDPLVRMLKAGQEKGS